ncbi:uncharacterized protein FIBRA_04410 [Fibroporia radiculosa]|uniref:RRM domain-containing protein n=1 Tax=Fibroporia radiculosa TaxID=599839 RepID=J4G7B4_9APHY|nr:uncharacterized protein FIBRA_04410 [Fibroporia radiculosa]CCM02318.1 predicted protein [Fibroporia radiculosa]
MAQTSSLPTSIAGFTPIPVSYSQSSIHILYARAHTGSHKPKSNAKGKNVDLPDARTLFLVNVPVDATERELTLFFKSCGTVERIVFHGEGDGAEVPEEESESEGEGEEGSNAGEDADDTAPEERPRKKRKTGKDAVPQIVPLPSVELRKFRCTGRSAHIIFLDDTSLSRALQQPSRPKPWQIDQSAPMGLSHYRALYDSLRPPLDVVRAHADSYMELFEHEQAKKRQESKYRMGEAVVDEDGFTLVTRGGAYGKTLGGGVGVASKKFQGNTESGGKRARRNKKEKGENDNFYAFQIHEKKRQELIDLKRKWEEDKAKVEKLKQSRKFRPY